MLEQRLKLLAYFILKGHINGAITGQERALNVVKHDCLAAYFILKGHVNGAIRGQERAVTVFNTTVWWPISF